MKRIITLFSLFLVFILGFKNHTNSAFDHPKTWPKPLYTFENNVLSDAKIELGRMLFYEPSLSINNQISCASCHSPYNAFAHTDHALSHGVFDSIGTRNAPALINLAWKKSFMWDGAIENLDRQALAPLTHRKEMGLNIEEIETRINSLNSFKIQAYNAYGDSTLSVQKILQSLAQFQLTLVSAGSKYDSVQANKSKFNTQELRGYNLFKKNCNSCHAEPLFFSNQFANNGLKPSKELHDVGRFAVTFNPNDSFYFSIPTLRNIEFSSPYMHDGRFNTMREVLNHYTDGITDREKVSAELKNEINMSSNDKSDIIAFLKCLSDTQFIFNNRHSYPKKNL